jgi:hypothetical protein
VAGVPANAGDISLWPAKVKGNVDRKLRGSRVARRGRVQSPGFWVVAFGLVIVAVGVAFLWLARASKPDVPGVARGVSFAGPITWPKPYAPWTARLVARFPLRSDANAMTRELLSEGFTVTPAQGEADYKAQKGFPCIDDYKIRWTADARGKLTSLSGFYFYSCI